MPRNPRAHLLATLIAALVAAGCAGNHGQPPLSADDPLKGLEVSYALPRTVLEVRAPVTLKKISKGGCTTHLTAPLTCNGKASTVADCLGLPASPNLASKHTLGTVTLGSRAEADPEQIYQVRLTGSALQKRRVMLELSEAGVLIQGESESKSKALSFATGILKSLAGLAAVFADEDQKEEVECLEVARSVLALRAQSGRLRDAILAGSPVPVDTAKLVLDRFAAEEKKLLEHYLKSTEVTAAVYCEITPALSDIATVTPEGKVINALEHKVPLFQVRQKTGVCAAGDPDCQSPADTQAIACFVPEALRAKDANVAPGERTDKVEIEFSYIEDQYAEQLREQGILTAGAGTERSFRYRVPAFAQVVLAVDTEDAGQSIRQSVLREERLIAQLGPVGSLPGDGADLYTVALYQDTGALKKITSLREPLDTANVTGIIDSLTTVATADKASDDELALLERERKILEERKLIRDLLKELEENE